MRFLIYGSRSFARTVTALIESCGHQVLGMLDDYSPTAPGVLGTFEDACRNHSRAAVVMALAIGYNDLDARWRAWQRIRAADWQTPSLVHPRAWIAPSARVGVGSLVMAGAIVDRDASLGEACVLWPGACINHDAQIGANTFISPNSTICGNAIVGANSFIGAAAVVVDGALLPDRSFVKMGSAYTQRAPMGPVKDIYPPAAK